MMKIVLTLLVSCFLCSGMELQKSSDLETFETVRIFPPVEDFDSVATCIVQVNVGSVLVITETATTIFFSEIITTEPVLFFRAKQ